jgi:hypothetical protein
MTGPANDQDTTHRSVHSLRSAFERGPAVVARGAVDDSTVGLWGEVLEIERGQSLAFVTLLDAHNDACAIKARLPLELCTFQLGEMVELEGRVELELLTRAPGAELVFNASRVLENRGVSRR